MGESGQVPWTILNVPNEKLLQTRYWNIVVCWNYDNSTEFQIYAFSDFHGFLYDSRLELVIQVARESQIKPQVLNCKSQVES